MGATLMLSMGVPLEQVETLRHTSISTTRRYAQVVEPVRREAVARMNAFLRETAHNSAGGTTAGTGE